MTNVCTYLLCFFIYSIKNSPVGVTKAHDDEKKEEIHNQIKAIMPDEKMGAVLKGFIHSDHCL